MEKLTTLIGITGNIATGKSVVRRMLSNSGALGLDADVIAHRMIYPQGPAFQGVLDAFGDEVLTPSGQISRARLGEIVFQDPEQLARLESIVHPAVTAAINKRLQRFQSPLCGLEAIKLLEAGLGEICDAVWVSHVPQETQLERLLQARGYSEDEACARIKAQPSQKEKLVQADAVIHTDGPFEHTWQQVGQALNDTIQIIETPLVFSSGWMAPPASRLPSKDLLSFWESQTDEGPNGFYQRLGLGMVQPLTREGQLQALFLWEAWNFTGTLTRLLPGDFILENSALVMEAFQGAARQQGCEIILLPDELVRSLEIKPGTLGFQRHKPADLPYPAWQVAASELKPQDQDGVWLRLLAQPLEANVDFQLK